jgi:hypothetical protein
MGETIITFSPKRGRALLIVLTNACAISTACAQTPGFSPRPARCCWAEGLDVVGDSQENFARLYADEFPKWAKVVKVIGLHPN